MPFIEFFYLNDSGEPSSVFIKVSDINSIPRTIAVDNKVIRPSVTFSSPSRIISVCNMPQLTAPGCEQICASLDMTIMTAEEVVSTDPDSPRSVSSKGSEDTDCTVETPSTMHATPPVDISNILKELAGQLETFGACVTAYRNYAADGMYRFDFQGEPHIVCASIVLLRKLANEMAETQDFTIGFDIPTDYDLPWCRLIFQVKHSGFGEQEIVHTRLMDTHRQLQREYEYMYEETALTDITVENGVVVDSRYLATENPWKTLVALLRSMEPPEPTETAESK